MALAICLIIILSAFPPLAISANPSPLPQCTWEPDPGPCRAFFRRYYYNNLTRSCEVFVHGGCDGRVPFRTNQQCENAHCDLLPDPEVTEHAYSFAKALADDPTLRIVTQFASTVME